jgi:hypothetical protein
MNKIILVISFIFTALPSYADECFLLPAVIVKKIDNNIYEVVAYKKYHYILKTTQTVYTSTGWTRIKVSKKYTTQKIALNNGFNEIWKVYHECNAYDKQQMDISNKERSRKRLKKQLKNTSLSNEEIEIWSKVGGRVSNIMGWKRLVGSPEIALDWVNSGFDLYDAKQWIRMGVESADDAKRWKYCTNAYNVKKLIQRGEKIPEKCDAYYQH